MSDLYVKKPSGRYRIADADTVFAQAARLRSELYPARRLIQSPTEASSLLREHIAHLPHEVFCALFLNTRHRVIEFEVLFRGTVDGATVHPREVVKRALQLNASALILGHNHPSGEPEPSESDRAITSKLSRALELVEIRLLDHLVIAGEHVVSLAERGWV